MSIFNQLLILFILILPPFPHLLHDVSRNFRQIIHFNDKKLTSYLLQSQFSFYFTSPRSCEKHRSSPLKHTLRYIYHVHKGGKHYEVSEDSCITDSMHSLHCYNHYSNTSKGSCYPWSSRHQPDQRCSAATH